MSNTTHQCCNLKEVATLHDAMKKHDFYGHKASDIRVISTRSSHVFLTGSYAYKIKKALHHPLCDHQTLQRRKAHCVKEYLINKRHSSDLYIDVLPIIFKDGQYSLPAIDSEFKPQDVVEYAVRMRQFNPNLMLDELIRRGQLVPEKVDEFALQVANLHQHNTPATAIDRVSLKEVSMQEVLQPVTDVFSEIKLAHQASNLPLPAQLVYLENWVNSEWKKLKSTFLQRKKAGFVRHCHGNLHLRKAVLIKNNVVLFDAVEHNDDLRIIDVASDIAFAMMDFERHHQESLSQRFLNSYLIETGDYALLKVLNFYKVYRALQRVKVASIKHAMSSNKEQKNQHASDIEAYTDLADAYTAEHRQGSLILSHGSLREGNDCIQHIADSLKMVHVRADVENVRIHCDNSTHQASGLGTAQLTYQLQKRLFDMTQLALDAGYYVIVDVQSLSTKIRDKFVEMAIAHRAPFLILNFQNDQNKLRALVREAIKADSNVVHIKSSELFKDVVESDVLINNYPILNITDESALPLGKIEQWLDNH